MKRIFIVTIFILFTAICTSGLTAQTSESPTGQGMNCSEEQKAIFRHHIQSTARQFIGIPFKLGGNPIHSGTADNSHLFFSIYALSAQKAGLSYKEYLPLKYLLQNIREVDGNDIKTGDLIVLNDDHMAMIYQIENTGRLHFIYASEKRQQVLSFNSDNVVFQAYWLENFKGFFRLSDMMLTPAD